MKSDKISKKVKIIILIILGILIIATIVLGLSMAYIKPVSNPEETNINLKTCAKISFKENSNSINLKNIYPMDEEKALEKDPYEFSVTSTCDGYFSFNLYLTSLSTNEIEDQNIHYAITDINKEILTEGILSKEKDGLNDFNTEELKELDNGLKGSRKNVYKIYSNVIPLNDESKYQLYLWLDKDAENETMGKTFQAGVSVKANKREETLAEYIIKNKDNNLIYHDGLPDYEGMENYELEAKDLSYRFVGINPNNFICFGGECSKDSTSENYKYLYRIIGLFKNNLNLYELKLIKADYLTTEETGTEGEYIANYNKSSDNYLGDKNNYFSKIAGFAWNKKNQNNNWLESELNTINLNEYYLNNFIGQGQNIDVNPNNWQRMISKHNWIIGGNSWDNIGQVYINEAYQNEILNQPKNIIVKEYVGLAYVSDYGYAVPSQYWASNILNNYNRVKTNNWMYMGLNEWLITPWLTTSSRGVFHINTSGIIGAVTAFNQEDYDIQGVRPSLYLTSSIKKLKGSGTKEEPYQIFID